MTRPHLIFLALAAINQNAWAQTVTNPKNLFLTPWRPPDGQECSVAKTRVPSLPVLFDTAALYQFANGLDKGSIVLGYVLPDTNWQPDYGPRADSMAIIETTLPDTQAHMLRDAFLRSQRRPSTVSFVLRLDLIDGPRLQLAPALQCRPVIANEAEVRHRLEALRSSTTGSREAVVRLIVRPNGTTTDARIYRTSGFPDFDDTALTIASMMRYYPGLVNRVPIPVLVQFPIALR